MTSTWNTRAPAAIRRVELGAQAQEVRRHQRGQHERPRRGSAGLTRPPAGPQPRDEEAVRAVAVREGEERSRQARVRQARGARPTRSSTRRAARPAPRPRSPRRSACRWSTRPGRRGAPAPAPRASRSRWSSTSGPSASSRRRQRASGRADSTPRPVHGGSTSTASKPPSQRDLPAVALDHLDDGAHAARQLAQRRRAGRAQLDGRDPRAAAGQRRQWVALAPGAAQRSSTRSPGCGCDDVGDELRRAALPHRQAAGPRPRVLERERRREDVRLGRQRVAAPASAGSSDSRPARGPAQRVPAQRRLGRPRRRPPYVRMASSAPSDATRRSAIQSGIEWRSAALSAPSASSPARRAGASSAMRRRTALTTPARADARGRGSRAARAPGGRPDRPRRGPARRRRRRSRRRPGAGCRARPAPARPGRSSGAVDEPVEGAPPLDGAVGQPRGLGAGARVELGARGPPRPARGRRRRPRPPGAARAARRCARARPVGGRPAASGTDGPMSSAPRQPRRNARRPSAPRPGGCSSQDLQRALGRSRPPAGRPGPSRPGGRVLVAGPGGPDLEGLAADRGRWRRCAARGRGRGAPARRRGGRGRARGRPAVILGASETPSSGCGAGVRAARPRGRRATSTSSGPAEVRQPRGERPAVVLAGHGAPRAPR